MEEAAVTVSKGDLYELAGYLSSALPELRDVPTDRIVAAVDEYIERCAAVPRPDASDQ